MLSFINNDFEFNVHNDIIDDTGFFIALDLTIENQRLSLISIYGPNEDNPEFYGKITKIIDNLENKHVIFVGDFNLVLKPELD